MGDSRLSGHFSPNLEFVMEEAILSISPSDPSGKFRQSRPLVIEKDMSTLAVLKPVNQERQSDEESGDSWRRSCTIRHPPSDVEGACSGSRQGDFRLREEP